VDLRFLLRTDLRNPPGAVALTFLVARKSDPADRQYVNSVASGSAKGQVFGGADADGPLISV
jgi:hypothetical protein